MKYFTDDFLAFFKDLADNNNRDWFAANKKRYETSVKKPFEYFVSDLIKSVSKLNKNINIAPSEAIFRINRDIRFSKDKTPYKLNSSAAIADGGRKNVASPGLYVELGPEKLALAGGIYMPDKEQLESIRSFIARDPKKLLKLLNDKKFASTWGDLQGEKNKIISPEFKAAAADCPYIFNKQFYFWTERKPSIITTDKLLPTIMEYYTLAIPLSKYLSEAVKSK